MYILCMCVCLYIYKIHICVHTKHVYHEIRLRALKKNETRLGREIRARSSVLLQQSVHCFL